MGKKTESVNHNVSMLIIDDDRAVLDLLYNVFHEDKAIRLETTSDSKRAMTLIKNHPYDIIVTDLMMPDIGGLDLLKTAKSIYPDVQVIIITAYSSLVVTLEIIKAGAYDYVTKPFQIDEILLVVSNAKEKIHLKRENEFAQSQNWLYKEEVKKLSRRCVALEEQLLKSQRKPRQSQRSQGFDSGGAAFLDRQTDSRKFVYQNPYQKRDMSPQDRYKQEFERLQMLHKDGILTDEDFDRISDRLRLKLLDSSP